MLEANMPRLKAQRTKDDYDTGKIKWLHPDVIFDVVMEATGSEELAKTYRVARIKADTPPTR
jgi:hypothetical protein